MLADKFKFSFFAQLVNFCLGILASIIVARLMGPAVLGMFSSALAIIALYSVFGDLGLSVAHIKILPQQVDKGASNGTFILLKSISVTILVIILAVYLAVTDLKDDPYYFKVLLLCAGVIIFEQIGRIPIATFSAQVDRKKAELPVLLSTILKVLVKIIAGFLGMGALALGSAELAGGLLMCFIAFFLYKNIKVSRAHWNMAAKYLMAAVPLLFIQYARINVPNIDKAMIKYFCVASDGNFQVGLYTAGQRFGSLLQIFMIVSGVIFFPTFAELTAKHNFVRIKEIIQKYQNFAICIIMPICAAVMLFALPILVFLVGDAYRGSAAILQVILVGLFFMLLFQPQVEFLIGGLGKFKLVSGIYLSFTLLNIALNAILIPENLFGYSMLGLKSLGAAIGTSIAYLCVGVIITYSTEKLAQISISKKDYAFEFLLISILFIFYKIVIHYIATESILLAVVGIPSFVCLFLYINYQYKKEHIQMAFSSLGKIHPILGFGLASDPAV